MRHHLSDARAVHLVILAIPFFVTVIALAGLTHGVPRLSKAATNASTSTLLAGRAAVAAPCSTRDTAAWSGPLVYWLLAALSRAVRRLLATTGLVVTGFVLGDVGNRLPPLPRPSQGASEGCCLRWHFVLALSPFYFGQAFRVLTDNPTWLFAVAALGFPSSVCPRAEDRPPRGIRLAGLRGHADAAVFRMALRAGRRCARQQRPHAPAFRGGGPPCSARALLPLVVLTSLWGGLLPRSSGPHRPGPPTCPEQPALEPGRHRGLRRPYGAREADSPDCPTACAVAGA